MKTSSSYQAIMFYDGSCPICRREVSHYQRIDGQQQVYWVDISSDPRILQAFGIPYQTAMSRLHVIDSQGNIVTGAAAFLALWRCLPYYRNLASVVSTLHLLPFLDWCYARFADWRWRNRQHHCQQC